MRGEQSTGIVFSTVNDIFVRGRVVDGMMEGVVIAGGGISNWPLTSERGLVST